MKRKIAWIIAAAMIISTFNPASAIANDNYTAEDFSDGGDTDESEDSLNSMNIGEDIEASNGDSDEEDIQSKSAEAAEEQPELSVEDTDQQTDSEIMQEAELQESELDEVDIAEPETDMTGDEDFSDELLTSTFSDEAEAAGESAISATEEFNGHRYAKYELGMTWDEANLYCKNMGGHLITVTSAAEEEFLEKLITSGEKNAYWMGGYADTSRKWHWTTGEDFSYTRWSSGQPDNFSASGGESALMIYRVNDLPGGYALRWNDLNADGTCGNNKFFGTDNMGFVCEWEYTDDSSDGQLNVLMVQGIEELDQDMYNMELALRYNECFEDTYNLTKLNFNKGIGTGTHKKKLDEAMDSAFAESKSSDTCLFFYTGHGDVSLDSLALKWNQYYKYSDLLEKLCTYKFKHMIVIIQACGAGAIEEAYNALSEKDKSKISVFWGAAKGQLGWYNDEHGYSAQIYTVARALGIQTSVDSKQGSYSGIYGADSNSDGAVTIGELGDYINNNISNVWTNVNTKFKAQTPGYASQNKGLVIWRYSPYLKTDTKNLVVPVNHSDTIKIMMADSNMHLQYDDTMVSCEEEYTDDVIKFHIKGLKAGTTKIKFTTPHSSETCNITVKGSLAVTPTALTLYPDQAKQLKATGNYGFGKVRWTSSNTAVASVINGKVTAKKAGIATITASVGSLKAGCTVTVKKVETRLNKSSATLYVGNSLQLKATVAGPNSTVAWKSSNPKVAGVYISGKVEARKEGTAVITATANGKTAKCTVTVKNAVKLSRTSLTLYVGQTYTLNAIGTNSRKTWSVKNEKIATVSSYGKVTAKKAGTTTIIVKSGNLAAKCTVIVKNASIKLNKSKATIYISGTKTVQLKATVSGASSKVTWKSSNPKVAAVSTTGKVTAKKVGKVSITASANGKSAKCVVTVKKSATSSKVYLQDVERIDSGKAKSSASDRPGDNYDKGGYDYFGNWYQYAYRFDGSTEDWAIYNLGKKYSTFEGTITTGRQTAPDTRFTGSGARINVYVYGDGKLLYSYEGLTLTTQPVHFKINVSNVSKLHIYATNPGAYYCGWMYFCNSFFTVK